MQAKKSASDLRCKENYLSYLGLILENFLGGLNTLGPVLGVLRFLSCRDEFGNFFHLLVQRVAIFVFWIQP